MASIDFTSLLVIVTPKQDRVEAVFAYPENANRCWTESASADHTDEEVMIGGKSGKASSSATPTVHLHLYLTTEPKNLLNGFVFGTDKNTCDVLLGRSRSSGISGNHFSIQIDWDSGNPILSCLSSKGVVLREEGTRQQLRTLSRDDAQTITPGSTLIVEVLHGFELTVSCPDRGNFQPTYKEKLKAYYGKYKDAVPDMDYVTLSQTDLTPFISRYYEGMNGGMYGTIHRMTTDDAEYDSKVFLYYTQRVSAATKNGRTAEPESEPIPPSRGKQPERHPTHLATTRLQDEASRPETTPFSFSDIEKSQMYVVKHFRDVRGPWFPPRSMAEKMSRVQHMNILRVVDFISMNTEFMVVNEFFMSTTLDSILRDAARLSSIESGFIMGQVLEGLKYLHSKEWTHGNLDPRSILVMARNVLIVKVADFALSEKADLGKPIGYHSDYASQKIAQKHDQYPMDIWSAGVVGLHLLEGVLPARSGYTLDRQHGYVVMLETHAKLLSRTRTDDKGLRFLTRVLQSKYQYRPTATALLQEPWIQDTKNYDVLQSPPISRSLTPQSSRHTSVGPSNRGPASIISRKSSKDRTAQPLTNSPSQNNYKDFDGEHRTPTQNSRSTANPPASEPSLGPRIPMTYNPENDSGRPTESQHSQSCNSGGNNLVAHDEHRSATTRSHRSDDPPSRISRASPGHNANDELNEEDGSEKAESVKSQGPVKKKARRAPAIPSSGASSGSQGQIPALRRSGRHAGA